MQIAAFTWGSEFFVKVRSKIVLPFFKLPEQASVLSVVNCKVGGFNFPFLCKFLSTGFLEYSALKASSLLFWLN